MESLLEKYIKGQEIKTQQQQAAIRNLEVQIGQLSKHLDNHPQGTLPSGTENNLKGNEHAKVVQLKSGRELEDIP